MPGGYVDYDRTKVRSRILGTLDDSYRGSTRVQVYQSDPLGNPTINKGRQRFLTGTEITQSEGHPFHSRKRGRPSDIGGPFFNQKRTFHGFHHVRLRTSGTESPFYRIVREYDGPMFPVVPKDTLFPPSMASSNEALDKLGATAVSRCKPTNPIVDLTAALAELKGEGLPHLHGSQLWKDKTVTARSAGSEYLNHQFGWAPLVSDVSAFGSGVIHAHSVIERYKAGIGKMQRRSYDFPISVDESTDYLGTGYPITYGLTFNYKNEGLIIRHRKVTRRRWFRGAFTYYFPYGLGGKLGDYAILARQLGAVPTPETVWNVAPWSWAVDWFSNTGDVISNWTSFHVDGLVMSYGYMMEHTIVEDTYRLDGAQFNTGPYVPVPPLRLVTETKIRRVANPYGFGLTWEGLNPFRLSILGALGLTKGVR